MKIVFSPIDSKDDSSKRKTILVAILSCLVEIGALALYFHQTIHVTALFMIHGMILGFVLLFAFVAYKKNEDVRNSLLLALAILGAGPLGSAGFLLIVLLYNVFTKFSTPTHLWLEELFPESVAPPMTLLFQRIRSKWNDYSHFSEISSFQDVFFHGSLTQKQAILDVISKDFHPIYFPLLKEALSDPSNTVRIQAAAIISKLDLDFETHLKQLLLEDLQGSDPRASLQIALLCDSYSSLELSDPVRQKQIQEKAIFYYQKHLSAFPDDLQAFFAIGKLMFRCRDFTAFLSWYDAYKKKYGSPPYVVHQWYLEALYYLHRYEELSLASRGI